MKDRLATIEAFFEEGKSIGERKDACVKRIRDYEDAIGVIEDKIAGYTTSGNSEGEKIAGLDIDIIRMKIDIENLKLQKLDILGSRS